ncbi:MAG: hypothetical protein QM296_06230 [Bacillota bacterium]|nr:hypothetical protein [Bacillota bacterium]
MASAFARLEPLTQKTGINIADAAIINQNPSLHFLDHTLRAIPIGYL